MYGSDAARDENSGKKVFKILSALQKNCDVICTSLCCDCTCMVLVWEFRNRKGFKLDM